jgi:hypothetical protein
MTRYLTLFFAHNSLLAIIQHGGIVILRARIFNQATFLSDKYLTRARELTKHWRKGNP